jgi:hypothetical protein
MRKELEALDEQQAQVLLEVIQRIREGFDIIDPEREDADE